MSKFLIENVVIDKSSKDIKTGNNYEFSAGLNLICGNNEAGKSSLMSFIRQGFFKAKNIDTGKIFFSLDSKKYRTDIKDARATDQRCKIYDENNMSVDYSFIERIINQKYFEQGFAIDLDDLMNIQNKDTATLVDIIKDPSGEKLSDYLEKTKLRAKQIFGDNGKLTRDISKILERISTVNSHINSLSNKESLYNSVVSSIKNYTEELDFICSKEDYYNLLLKIKEKVEKVSDLEEEFSLLALNYNEKLFFDNERYLSIIHNAGKYSSNQNILEKNTLKLEALKTKINIDLNTLNTEYALNIAESGILNYSLDYSKINDIKASLEEKNILEKELLIVNATKETLEDNLSKLKYELKPLEEKFVDSSTIESLQKIYESLDEGLKKYNFLLNKITDAKKSTKLNAVGIISNKKLLILFGSLFVLTVICAILSFNAKVPTAGIFSIFMSFLCAFGFISMKLASYEDKIDSAIIQDEKTKDELLISLKDIVRSYYNEIDNVVSSYLPIKLESLKQEIFNKIQNSKSINEFITKNKSDSEYHIEKFEKENLKAQNLNERINSINEKINELIKSESIEIKVNLYLEVIEIIKSLKENIVEKNNLEAEFTEISAENNLILNTLNQFIEENNINISVSDKYEDNVGKIKAINEKNLGIKNQLDILNAQIQVDKAKINELEVEKDKYSKIATVQCPSGIEIMLEELQNEKKEVLNKKKEAEFQKRELESFEGLNDLKIQKNILVDDYRKKIAQLLKYKMIISFIETAKSNFDKTQPDLKNAEKYLSILTGGKYSKINLDLMEIQNEDATVIKKWDILSRGTKEQLYLALRLGYASNYSKDKVTLEENGRFDLPIIIDDAFVNFDFERTRNAVKCLAEFSKTNQVLFFTCHTELMKKHFESLNEKFNVINL